MRTAPASRPSVRRRPVQGELPFRTWGGRRKGAGRKPGPRPLVQHRSREHIRRPTPVHVTLRVLPHVWNLRTARCAAAIGGACRAGKERFGFRLVHLSVQGNHLHLFAEVADGDALRRGMQGLSIRIARALNRVMGRKGKVFAGRFHARRAASPREVRVALRYVLCNAHKHAAEQGRGPAPGWLDRFSTARYFDGWRGRLADPLPDHAIVVTPRLWLVTTGWRRHGLLGTDESPGAAPSRPWRSLLGIRNTPSRSPGR